MVNCKHRQGTINGICITCSTPINLPQLKYNDELRRMEEKDAIQRDREMC